MLNTGSQIPDTKTEKLQREDSEGPITTDLPWRVRKVLREYPSGPRMGSSCFRLLRMRRGVGVMAGGGAG